MIELLAQIIFYALVLLLGLYSLVMIYVLLRFGESKILGLAVSALYLIIILSLFGAATLNFNRIPFPI